MDLKSPVTSLPKVGPIFAAKFEKLGIFSIEDLFYHVPSRYMDYSLVTTINKLSPGETVTIHAKIVSIANIQSKRGLLMQIGSVEDATGKVTVLWFNQPYLVRTLYPGRLVSLSGKVGFFSRKLTLNSPDFEILDGLDSETVHTGRLVPIYPETAGLSSKWIRTKIKDAYQTFGEIEDFLPKETLKASSLISLNEAINLVHFPKDLKDVEPGIKRLAFNELLFMHLKSVYRKTKWKNNKPTYELSVNSSTVQQFMSSLPFTLTDSQKKAIDEILSDFKKNYPMNRLLEGDVGSGKTVIAALAAFIAFGNGYQTVFMAPTQILAEQHYKTLRSLLDPFKVRVSLITSSVKKLEMGRSDVFIGTHSLIHSTVEFDKVALVVIDEQHRFGVEQRAHLVKKSGRKSIVPHVLTMTATPIPRTIALTSYGDLELSTLTELPKGRQKITTWLVPPQKRKGAYEWIKSQISNNKSQAFVVCPLIELSDKETMEGVKAATEEFKNLKLIFKNFKLGLLHGKVKPAEKEKVLDDFRNGKIDILVTTPVVEVGIDIPNATIMVIEAAERFGLAQLHQLRGRVGRGEKKSYCLLFSGTRGVNSTKRLKAMTKMHSGFELAELDLKMRGPGEIFGTRQAGFAELKVASWSNYELIKETKEVAEDVFKNPKKYPKLTADLNRFLETA